MNSGEWQAWIAASAAVVSVCAAAFSAVQARQSKRQADAASGEFEPVCYIIYNTRTSGDAEYCIVVENHNRIPLVLDEVILEHPIGTISIAIPEPDGPNWFGRRFGLRQNDDELVLRPEIIIPGLPLAGGVLSSFKHRFWINHVDKSTSDDKKTIAFRSDLNLGQVQIEYKVSYRMLDGKDISKVKSGLAGPRI